MQFSIEPLESVMDTSGTMDEVEGIVISGDMRDRVDGLQSMRAGAGQRPFEVFVAQELLADDGLPLRSSRIVAGEVDENGRIAGTMKVLVGTTNGTKVEAVRRVFARLYPEQPVDVTGVEVTTAVPDQPWGPEVARGALARARAAMASATPVPPGAGDETEGPGRDALPHFAVGIEAGLIPGEAGGPTFDVQHCAVIDRGGRETMGHGPGFVYPDDLLEEVREGKQVREVMMARYWTDPSDRGKGAVHTFTAGHMDRLALTEQAVLMAMVPRISGEHGF
jgi:inosine/xanthosine triphosphatase